MKFNYLIKASPLFSVILLTIFLSLSNQKEYTKLRILIWNTPTLSLGTYLALSTTSGFILSYFFTTSLAKAYQLKPEKLLEFRYEEKHEENIENQDLTVNKTYDNTLIEREISDPSPTINASFRIIGKRDRTSNNSISSDSFKYNESINFEDTYDEIEFDSETKSSAKSYSNDWNDDSFTTW